MTVAPAQQAPEEVKDEMMAAARRDGLLRFELLGDLLLLLPHQLAGVTWQPIVSRRAPSASLLPSHRRSGSSQPTGSDRLLRFSAWRGYGRGRRWFTALLWDLLCAAVGRALCVRRVARMLPPADAQVDSDTDDSAESAEGRAGMRVPAELLLGRGGWVRWEEDGLQLAADVTRSALMVGGAEERRRLADCVVAGACIALRHRQ